MAKFYTYQAKDSVTGEMYYWTTSSATGSTGYPGPNTATEKARIALHGSDGGGEVGPVAASEVDNDSAVDGDTVADALEALYGRVGGLVRIESAITMHDVSSVESEWHSASFAPLARSTDDIAVRVRVFDDGQADGVGLTHSVLTEALTLVLSSRPRGFVSTANTEWSLYARQLGGEWSEVGAVEQEYEDGSWVETTLEVDLTGFSGAIQLELERSGGTLGGVELAQVRFS